MKAACASVGLVYTIWLTRNFTAAEVLQAAVNSQCQGVIVEGEIPAEIGPGQANPQAVNWAELAHVMADLPIPKAVATNFAPFIHHDGTPAPEIAKPLIDAGWACITECYLGESPNSTPENQDFYATRNLGWPETQPVIGLYAGKTWADYPTRDNYRNWSVWDAGEVL